MDEIEREAICFLDLEDARRRIKELEAALTTIVEVYDMRSEIFTMHDDVAENLALRAKAALNRR